MQRLLHTPEGFRDLYKDECSEKQWLGQELQKVFSSYGYESIETPTVEFLEVFGQEIGTTPSRELYRFFDREGNTLVLRPDFTPSIARAASMYFHGEKRPLRFSYQGNTFTNNVSYQGRLKESTQMGVELLGDASPDADGEILALAVELLCKTGLSDFQISVGQVDFFGALAGEAGLEGEDYRRLCSLISNKNRFGVEEFCENLQLSEKLKKVFGRLPQLFGGPEVLSEAESLTENPRALAAVKRLREIWQVLECYGCQSHIFFDLGQIGRYGYYTGIIFQGYTYGSGEPLVKGGRYDRLLEHFGNPSPAVGFGLVMEQILNALSRQNISLPAGRIKTAVLYSIRTRQEALKKAGWLRNSGESVTCFCTEEKGEPDLSGFDNVLRF